MILFCKCLFRGRSGRHADSNIREKRKLCFHFRGCAESGDIVDVDGLAPDTRNESRRNPSEEDASIFFRGDDRESERSEDVLAGRAPEKKRIAEQD